MLLSRTQWTFKLTLDIHFVIPSWHCISKSKLHSLTALETEVKIRFGSHLVIPFLSCFRGGCPAKLYSGPRPLWALRGSEIREQDLTRPPGSPPRAQECSSENLAVQQQHAAVSLTNDGCMAAAMCSRGRAGFLLTRNCLTERQVRGVRARQIS